MKRKVKRILSLLLCVLLLCATVSLQASAETYSGNCGASGSNVTWNLSAETGALTISGTGAIKDYDYDSKAPWDSHRLDITKVVIESGVTGIGHYSFRLCRNLTNVTIPNSVTRIGKYSFSCCSSLTNVTLPDNIDIIGACAFEECTSLIDLTIPKTVSLIGTNAFHYVCNITYNGTSYDSPWGAKSRNGYVDGLLVFDSAEKKTLCACSSSLIGNATIPNSVTSIGDNAFSCCVDLTSVSIPNSVVSVGKNAFEHCENLTNVTIPNSVTNIAGYAFSFCSKLTDVELSNEIKDIATGTFEYCKKLSHVTIPNKVESIEGEAFKSCDNLTSVTIPDSVTYIGSFAFSNCNSLTNVIIPNNTRYIGNMAFYGSGNLAYYGSATGSPWGAAAVNKYVEGPFVFDSGEKKTLIWCSRNTQGNIVIPNGVDTIEADAFLMCNSLSSVTIPDSLRIICENSFCECWNLVDISIGSGVKLIKQNAFSGCTKLRSVYYNGTAADWGSIHIEEGNDPLILAERTYRPSAPMTLSETSLTMHFKDTKTLTATRKVEWSSDNEKAVKVDATGKLTAVGKGKATVTATDPMTGDTAKCAVTVKYSFAQILIRIFLFGWIWYK